MFPAGIILFALDIGILCMYNICMDRITFEWDDYKNEVNQNYISQKGYDL